MADKGADKARKAEIERKKAQLRALREKKKAAEQKQKVPPARTQPQQAPVPAQPAEASEDINDLVSSLLADRPAPQNEPPAATGSSIPASEQPVSSVQTAPQLSIAERLARLSVAKAFDWHVQTAEPVVYERGTQTDKDMVALTEEEDVVEAAVASDYDGDSATVPETVPDGSEEAAVSPVQHATLTEDEIRLATESLVYGEFVTRSVPVVERCLTMNERYDYMVDYAQERGEDGDQTGTEAALTFEAKFSDSTHLATKTATCMAMDWSTHHPELVAAGYGSTDTGGGKNDGAVMLWNRHVPQRPEMVFKAQSSVTAVHMSPFDPNLIVGGTYSGQVVLWDTRSKATPVQRTPLGSESHTHPVYSLAFVGTQNAHNLITASTDGRMCSWSLDMLAKSQDTMSLQHKQTKAVSVTSMSFVDGDTNNFVVSSEDGSVYTACRHGGKAGIVDVYRGHHGPVTAVRYHKRVPGSQSTDLSDVFVSSSTDWTVKLWSTKISTPLVTFDYAGNYVYDVAWSPRHPGAFAYVNGCNLSLVDMTADLETPVTSLEVNTENRASVNLLRWSADGSRIACCDARGGIHVYSVGESYSKPGNIGDLCTKTADIIGDLKSCKN